MSTPQPKSGTLRDYALAGRSLPLFVIVARKLYKMDLLTIGDFYRRRYGRGVEIFSSIVILISYLGGDHVDCVGHVACTFDHVR